MTNPRWRAPRCQCFAASSDRFGRDLGGRRDLLGRRGLVGDALHPGVFRHARPCRDQAAHDDVLLETDEAVDLAVDRRFGEHLGRLLEGSGRDEALRREARLGDAEQQRLRHRRLTAPPEHPLVLLLEPPLLYLVADQEVGVTHLLDAHPAQHLPDDDLDVLVVDADALQAIDLLHLVHQVLGERLLAEDGEDVVRVRAAVHEWLARLHVVAFVDADVLALGDQVFARFADLRGDDDLALALGVLAEGDDPVDLADDGELLRLAGLEQLGDARQTAGDVLRLGGLARHLGDDVARGDRLTLDHVQVCADGKQVARLPTAARHLGRLPGGVLDGHARPLVDVLGVDDDLGGETGPLVDLLLHGDALDDVAELHHATRLGDDRDGVGVPLGDHLGRFHLGPVALLQLGAVDDRIALALTLALRLGIVDDRHLAVAAHDDEVAVLALDRAHVDELQEALVARLQCRLLRAPARRTADVERPHRELRARLADRLRGDDADGLAEVDEMAARQVAAVALHADPLARLAGEHRADLHPLEARLLDGGHLGLVDLVVGLHDDGVGERVANVLERDTPEHAIAETLDDLAALDQRGHLDAVERPAVLLRDDRVLRDVDETPREIAGVGRLQRGVGEPLPCAVRRDEVLKHGEPLAEVCSDGRLDDLARRLRHEAAHAGQLPDLLRRAAGAGIGHHEDRVEGRDPADVPVGVADLLRPELAQDLVGDAVGHLRPDVDDLVVALAIGDETLVVLVLDLPDRRVGLLEQLVLARRNHHVLDADRDARLRGLLVAEVLQPIGEDDGGLVPRVAVGQVDQGPELLLLHDLVDLGEGDLGGDDFVEEHAAGRRVHDLAVRAEVGGDAHTDAGLDVDLTLVVRDPDLVEVRERVSLAARGQVLAGHEVQAEDDVLRRHDDRLPVRRRKDVVGGHHERPGLDLRLHRQRYVDRHLVAVEVGVVGRADEGVQLDGLALDEDRLERLDAEPMERRGAVQEDGMLADHLVEDVPDLGTLFLDHLLGALDGRDVPALLELVVDERLEQLERHLLRQPALVESELGPDDDHRAAGVVDALAEKVLPEPAALTLQHVRQRLEGPLVRAGDRPAAPAVVEEGVDGLLEHALLVADDDVGRVQLHEALQAVVPVDDAPVEVVQVRGGEAAAVERHEGPQVGRDHRDDLEDHPLGMVPGVLERGDDLQPLGDLLPAGLARRVLHLHPEVDAEFVDVELAEKLADGLGAHLGPKGIPAVLLVELPVAALGEQLALLQRRRTRIDDDVGLEIEDLLELLERHVEERTDSGGEALQEPDVRHRRGEVDVAHALPAALRLDHLDAALLSHDPAVL